MENGRNKYLIKNTLIFTLGNLGSKVISFFLIPLYTNVLTTAQYGTIDLVMTVSTVIAPILTLNICESVMRFALDKDADHQQITRIGTHLLLTGCVVGLLIFPICSNFERLTPYAGYTYFYVISMAASQIYLCDLRGKELLLPYSIGNLLQTFFVAVLNITFLLYFKMGVEGYFLAYIIANVIVTIYALTIGRGYKVFVWKRIDVALLTKMVQYSVVLIPNSFMWWIMNSSDRIMVTSMVSIAANGIYAISYKLPTLVSTLTSIFNQAWCYSAVKEEGASDESEYNNQMFKVLTSMVMLIGIGVMAFTKPFLRFYVASDFYEAWRYVPYLLIGCVYLTMGSFMATSYTVHKDSFGYLFSALFGAGTNILLNFILIPRIYIYGAAIATCVSYIMVFIFRLIHTRKYIKYSIANKEFVLGTAILLGSAAITYWDNGIATALQCVMLAVALAVFAEVWKPILKKMVNIPKTK